MPYDKAMPEDAGPGEVFSSYPEIYSHWTQMGEQLINGPSPLTPGERELIQAYVAGIANIQYSLIAHAEAAYARGIERGLVDALIKDIETAPIEARWKPIFYFVKKLTLDPASVQDQDAKEIFSEGWDQRVFHDVIAVTARMNFMCRIVEGYGFTPKTPEAAREQAEHRAKVGYVDLYPNMKK
jgi:uncharacterized peroxidase-related enzyme